MTEMAQPDASVTLSPAPQGAHVQPQNRLVVFLHALAFVVGFSIVFIFLGVVAGLLGFGMEQNFRQLIPILQRLGAVLLVLFALTTLGVFRWLAQKIRQDGQLQQNPAAVALLHIFDFFDTLLYTERRVTQMHTVNRNWGYLSSILLGMSFSAGWLPCIGPILSSIFVLASSSSTVAQGAALLAVYSLGLGMPFLIAGAAFSRVTRWLRRLNRYANIISLVSGLFLLYVAYLLWGGALATLTTQLNFLNLWVFAIEDWVTVTSGTGGDIMSLSFAAAAPLAFIAGFISFISPCVLPLVPAYIGYLSSAAVGSGKA
ncbi:MAG: sulfite exporter TauE/SafE family protein [Caldilineaceae bacterium]|nr:sulfite exporter TauE/SafE family protein [Caldilineaceae bacterium]